MDIIKEALKQSVENFLYSSFHITKNIQIMKTKINKASCNFCFIDNEPTFNDIDFIKNRLDVDATILSKNKVELEIENCFYIGEYPLMKREEVPDFYQAPHYDDLEILNVEEYPMIIKDYVDIFAKVRGIDEEKIISTFNFEGLKNNNHFFVAYLSENPAGIFHAISYNDEAFIVEVSVKEQYRNSGILTAMAKAAKEHALKIGVYNFYALPTSEFSVRVMNDQGYKMVDSYHIWQNIK